MKRIMTMLLLAVSVLAAQAQEEVYKAEMDIIDAQGEAIIQQYRALMKQDPKAEQPATKAKIVVLFDALDSLSQAQVQLVRRIIRENKDNNIPVPYIVEAMQLLGYDGLKEALDPKAAYYNHPDLAKAKQLLATYDKRAPGTKFKDMTMNDMDGKELTLSQWAGKGNYVLVDFWASWCGPCRQEMPNVVVNYEKYHAKGFEIVGVSFDQNKEPWVKAVQTMGLRWPQMSDLKGWQCAASDLYGIRSIPASVLIDPQGTIIALYLRGKALGKKRKELFGE